MSKAISNEEAVTAILTSKTIAEASKKLGINARTLYERMNQRDFKALYSQAKSDLLRGTLVRLSDKAESATEEISAIMADKEINPAIRLQAAQTILNSIAKFYTSLLSAEAVAEQQGENTFDFNF